jgi:hypothetical protein
MPVSKPQPSLFFDTSHNATNHGPGAPIFEGKVPFSQQPSVQLDRRVAPFDGGFHCAYKDTLFGRARGEGGTVGN